MSEEMERYTYRTTKERLDRLKMRAIKEGTTINKIVDKLLDEYLEK